MKKIYIFKHNPIPNTPPSLIPLALGRLPLKPLLAQYKPFKLNNSKGLLKFEFVTGV